MYKRILVTGASGFIGSRVCKKLSKYKLFAVISPFSDKKRQLSKNKHLSVFKINLEDATKVDKLFKRIKPDIVIHLATHGVYQYQQNDEERIVKGNYLMTLNLLESSIRYGVKKFINTGSVFEYGSRAGKVKEKDIDLKDILNKYSAVKMATTALANSFANKIKIITLRPFTTYGQGEDETRFVRSTIIRALNNEPIRIVKGVIRDFVYVDDVADAYVKAVGKDFISGEILSIGSGKKSTLDEVALLIKKLTNSKSKIVFDDKYVREKESRCWADISAAKKILNWEPKTNLKNGIVKSVDFIKK